MTSFVSSHWQQFPLEIYKGINALWQCMNAELPEHFWLASKVMISQFLKYIFLLYQHWIGAEGTCISKLTLGSISIASAASAVQMKQHDRGTRGERVIAKILSFFIRQHLVLSTHLSPPSLTWQIQGCQWAEPAGEISQSPPHSPFDIFSFRNMKWVLINWARRYHDIFWQCQDKSALFTRPGPVKNW